ncbi:unnamed protein product, partial [Rotaria sp. Silwood1]
MKMFIILNFPITTILLFSIVNSSTGVIPQCGSDKHCCQTAATLKKVGFASAKINVMTAIAYYESGWGTHNGPKMNDDGSGDYGLFQINSYLWCSLSGKQNDCCCPGTYPQCRKNSTLRTCACGCNVGCLQVLSDNNLNAQCAAIIFSRQGYTAWAAYKSHASECDFYSIFFGQCSSGNCCSDINP